jgi:hypothetical protein
MNMHNLIKMLELFTLFTPNFMHIQSPPTNFATHVLLRLGKHPSVVTHFPRHVGNIRKSKTPMSTSIVAFNLPSTYF